MHCKSFWEIYETQGLTFELEQHLKGCESCRKAMQAEKLLKEHAGMQPIYRAPDILWARINTGLAASGFRNRFSNLIQRLTNSVVRFLSACMELAVVKPVMIGVTFGIVIGVGIGYLYFLPVAPNEEIRQFEKASTEFNKAEQNYRNAVEKFSSIVNQYERNGAPELYRLYQTRLTALTSCMEQYREIQRLKAYDIMSNSYLYEIHAVQ